MCYVTMASRPPSVASSTSRLNPNAPAFVPASFMAAEDFSPEWWRLIQSSASFREWWMKERYSADDEEPTAPAREQDDVGGVGNEFDDIDELLELGFQSGILDDMDDQPYARPQQPPPPPQHPQQQQIGAREPPKPATTGAVGASREDGDAGKTALK